jgi:hypothetical protein
MSGDCTRNAESEKSARALFKAYMYGAAKIRLRKLGEARTGLKFCLPS